MRRPSKSTTSNLAPIVEILAHRGQMFEPGENESGNRVKAALGRWGVLLPEDETCSIIFSCSGGVEPLHRLIPLMGWTGRAPGCDYPATQRIYLWTSGPGPNCATSRCLHQTTKSSRVLRGNLKRGGSSATSRAFSFLECDAREANSLPSEPPKCLSLRLGCLPGVDEEFQSIGVEPLTHRIESHLA